MAAAGGPRCLSDLPDDVLRRTLYFAPAREGAATAVLSRRWRWLWRTSGAVNLDTRSFCSSHDEPEVQSQAQPWDWRFESYVRRFSIKGREAFLCGAGEALAAAAGPVTRLAVVVAEDSRIHPTLLVDGSKHDLIGAVIGNPAAQHVEELLVEVEDWNKEITLSFGSLQSETLRTARIISRGSITAARPDTAFQQLVDLHLERCTVPLNDLQRIVDAAPKLEKLHLESCYMPPKEEEEEKEDEEFDGPVPNVVRRCRIVFPVVAAIVFARCTYPRKEVRLELDAPRLRYLRYEGDVQHSDTLSLKQQAASSSYLARVDLDLSVDYHAGDQVREPFWRFIRNFSTVKVLKIQLDFTMDRVALVAKESQDDLLGGLLFRHLERLELQGQYEPRSKTSMVMLANLLHCFPVLCDLRVKLSKDLTSRKRSSIDKEARADFDKSVDRFRHRRSRTLSLSGENDINHEASYIPGLNDESLNCLQSYLRRVSLHFCMEEPNCLGVQLAKFFVDNAMVLEETHIDDGSQKMCEHMNTSVGRWIAKNSTKMRNLAGVTVLPC
ncbi:unnamed protein product [Urochloa decumbens]|uniref:F-box/LRR-repeat protein 15/At3g58940/PEG3-like LRR domain-containing protein n=1 Tax=Urochloa decumbens TaxID=240449 RepID=A0ABC9AJV4_9POAL